MADISPYQIVVPEEQIVDLKQRLALAKFPRDELESSGWDYGSPLSDVKALTTYWRDQFDWRKTEAQLNTLPHFTMRIQCDGFESLKIHFLHKKSDVEAAIPLLFVHGCE
jgi:Epoxide hydrolase N terminus